MPHATRIGVACAGDPTDPSAFSGTPAAVLAGLRANGIDARPIAAVPPAQPHIHRALAATHLRPQHLRTGLRAGMRDTQTRLTASPTLAALRTLAARRALASADVEGCIQFGTAFAFPRATPYVTYDDMTIVQAARAYPYEWTRRLSEREMARMVAQQRRVFHAATACCATTDWAAASIVDDYGVPAERVFAVGVGATHVAATVPERDWGVPRFLFVGKDWARKNGDAIVAAFAEIRRERPDAELDVVGGHPPLDADGVRGHGLVTPGDPLLVELFARATCFVMPSLHEPSALSYVEAASAGVGAIGTTSGGSRTLIGDGGLVVDPRKPAEIVDAMRAFCAPEVAAAYGRAAAARAPLFSWPAVARRLVAALTGDRANAALPRSD